MILAPVIQPACVVLRVHLECEVKGAVREMGTELDPFLTLTLALIALPALAPHQWPIGFILPKEGKDSGHVVSCRKEAKVKGKHHR